MAIIFTNNASALLATSLATTQTAIVVDVGEGARFPIPSGGDYFKATLEDSGGNIEIVHCSTRVGDVLTVARAQEGTPATFFPAGSRIELRVTKEMLEEFIQRSGDTMTGPLDLGSEALTNVGAMDANSVDANELLGPLRGATGVSGNQITVPANGTSDPLVGGSAIWHAGNLTPSDYAPVAHQHPTSDITPVAEWADGFISETAVTQHKQPMDKLPVVQELGQVINLSSTHIASKVLCAFSGNVTVNIVAANFDATNVGDTIFIANRTGGAFTVTVQLSGGGTLYSSDNVTPVVINNQNGVVALHCTAADVWDVVGDYG
jgi:hypothetical protein